jgi:1-acyl-sn-glycerol-3-phosphate acyltransferase
MTARTEIAAAAAPRGRQDAFAWRFVATGFSFLTFGVGAVVFGLLVLPVVRALPAPRIERRRRARATVRAAMRFFVGLMRSLGVLTYTLSGIERLGRPGQLIIANHPSLIDVVFLLAITPPTNCVVKQGLWRNPLTRGAVTMAEYISNDPTAEMIEASASVLQAGQTLIMFPEGTRTVPSQPFVFHRGAANVALRAATAVTPVYIRCEPTTLTKAEPWYRIPVRRVHFSLEVGEDIDLTPFRDRGPLPAASRALNASLQQHFQEQLAEVRPADCRTNCQPCQ